MEIYISNLDPRAKSEEVQEWLDPILEKLKLHASRVYKPKRKNHAFFTVADKNLGNMLVCNSSSVIGSQRRPPINHNTAFWQSKRPLDPFTVQALEEEGKKYRSRLKAEKWDNASNRIRLKERNNVNKLHVRTIEIGTWEYVGEQLTFVSFSAINGNAILTRDERAMSLAISRDDKHSSIVLFDFNTIRSFAFSRNSSDTQFAMTLSQAPKIYTGPARTPGSTQEINPLTALFLQLQIGGESVEEVCRESKLDWIDDQISQGSCLVYSFTLSKKVPENDLVRSLRHLASGKPHVWREARYRLTNSTTKFADQVTELNSALRARELSFATRFQLEALWSNAQLSPSQIIRLLPLIDHLQGCDRKSLTTKLRILNSQIQPTEPGTLFSETGFEQAKGILLYGDGYLNRRERRRRNGEIMVHRVTVTPTGCYLYGPEPEFPNRVLRQFPGHEACFIRVMFGDEDGDRIPFENNVTNEKILYQRFLHILGEGLVIAGRRFNFLGFSQSSLKSSSCWLMRDFVHDGVKRTARIVISDLGDFDSFRNPAKCAARIGQAFTDVQRTVTIDKNEVTEIDDIIRGRFNFTDGCGSISKELWSDLHSKLSYEKEPTLYQIRYKGAKGMLSLDTSLKGRQILLRPSMIKFRGSPSDDLEICQTNARAIAFKLNREIIKILEDLKIPDEVFLRLQSQAVATLRQSASSASSAVDYLCSRLSGSVTSISPLLRCLAEQDIDVVEDNFLRDILRVLIGIELRDIKFRGRIPIQKAKSLLGISDVTGILEAGQVFVTFQHEGDDEIIEGKIAITRSPAMHPGDIQTAQAVAVPRESPLRHLTNCVVFSQKGHRDLPSMLGGGDLDGDLFNIIYDEKLVPVVCDQAAAYPQAASMDVERPVTTNDMTKFFVDFIANDQMGVIATRHKIFADQHPEGVRSETCVKLAELYSLAVDFPKSGIPVDFRQIPRLPGSSRPDFLAPAVNTRIERNLGFGEASQIEERSGSRNYLEYPSTRVLGKLFRAIDEDDFFDQLEDDSHSVLSYTEAGDVLIQIWDLVVGKLRHENWRTLLDKAREARDYYNWTLQCIMSDYTDERRRYLTEKEVIVGQIIGKKGASNARLRERSEQMKSAFKLEVQDLRSWMQEQVGNDAEQYTDLAVACLSLHVPSSGVAATASNEDLKSFPYIAAAICVPRLLQDDDAH